MRVRLRHPIGVIAIAMLTLVAGACAPSSLADLSGVSLLPRADQFSRPDWLTYSGGREETLRPVTAADLVSQDGQCAMTAAEAAPSPDGDPNAPPQLAAGGIALQMTECDVVRRGGPPEQLQIGADERGERAVVITYMRGPRPGIYRFAAGRLNSIERAPGVPAERPQKGKAKKAARN